MRSVGRHRTELPRSFPVGTAGLREALIWVETLLTL
ncbi:MAG: hypothetical protein JWR32_3296 [Mycobacterium sp.]|nr:hypothetical protein [Mycobacterium sp.]